MSDEAVTEPAGPPAVMIFDVNETLSDMGPLAESFERVGLDRGAVEPWFAGVLRDGFALTSAGVNPAFADLAAEALRVRLVAARGMGAARGGRAGADHQSEVDDVMSNFASLSVHPDVVEGVQALRERGVRLVTLSNGARNVAQDLLERAGIVDAFETLLSVSDAAAWKPHPASYAHALAACGISAGEAMLVAVHPWDIDGAARAGLRAAWLNRSRGRYPTYFTPPEVQAADLVGLAQELH